MSRSHRDETKGRAPALAALAFGLVAPLAYIAQRLLDHALVGGEVDPLSMLRQSHVAYVWRAATAAFWGGLAAMLALSLDGARTWQPPTRKIAYLVVAATLGFALLAWVFP